MLYVFTFAPSIVICNDPIGNIVVLLVEKRDGQEWRYAHPLTAEQANRLVHKIMERIARMGHMFSIDLNHWFN